MDEEQELAGTTNVQVKTQTSTAVDQEKKVEDLPRFEELVKSEKEISQKPMAEKTTIVAPTMLGEDRVFAKKSDEKKAHIKKRLKIVTAVYSTVVALLLGFVITNVATLAILDNKINSNTETINSVQQQIIELEDEITPSEIEKLPISLNEPRDYSEDKQELTFLDKMTILFRNLFG